MKILTFTILLPLFLLFCTWRTYTTQHSPLQEKFLKGKASSPQGFLKGSVNAKTNWLGKKFNKEEATGINVFAKDETQEERYKFKTYVAKGLADPSIEVLKIDYNIPGNPFWLRLILDEIVETEPGKYLGKLHLRLLPRLSFALGFFSLRK
jgi:hypothetical protein